MNPKVDAFLGRAEQWRDEMSELRRILLDCDLTEELKWGKPCYAFEGSNVVIIQGFKDYCALLFFKGFLLLDPEGVLVKTGKNTRVGRQIRFTSVREIGATKTVLKSYVREAIEVEKSGPTVDLDTNVELELPEEFTRKLREMPALKEAFDALTPGRQRGYSYFFSEPKQSKTREARVDKSVPNILDGRGLNDR